MPLDLPSQDLVSKSFMEEVKKNTNNPHPLRCTEGQEYIWSIGAPLTFEREIESEKILKKGSEEQKDLI